MAHALRLRRALSLSAAVISPTRRNIVITAVNAVATTLHQSPAATNSAVRHFHSTQQLSSSYANRSFNDIDKIDADTILFEGCDYNHFLIVMDFGKDPNQRPPPEQMIETYVQTAAKVCGSVEEAKRKIYACSTTTYTGFQVEVDEETSKKFEGLPGVTFVLPDSYIDPVNKEYGGDKYVNGVITPRPPPVQYRRTSRQNDRPPRDPMPIQQGNPSYNQQGNRASNGQGNPAYNNQLGNPAPAYNQQGNRASYQHGNPAYNQLGNPAPAYNQGGNPAPAYNQVGNPAPAYNPVGNPAPAYNPVGNPAPAYNQLGSVPQGGRGYPPQVPQHGFPQSQSYPSQQNYPQQQNYPPQQNYGLSGQADRGTPVPGGPYYPSVVRDGFQGGQRNLVPSQEGNYNRDYNHPQGQMSNQPGNHGGYAPPGQFRSDSGKYAHNQPEGQGGNQMRNPGKYEPRQMRNLGDNRSSFSSPVAGAYGQAGAGNFEQNEAAQYRQGPTGNDYGPGAGYIPHGHGENPRFQSIEQSNPMDHGINSPGAQMGFNQGRY